MDLLERTFQLTRGVGPWRERDLWARGIATWEDFETRAAHEVVMSSGLDAELRAAIAQARAALHDASLGALAAVVPPREHWRLFGHFVERAVFLDVEADGEGRPTVVGAFDAEGVTVHLEGDDPARIVERLSRWPLWVTFNGGAFDLPVLRRAFPELTLPTVHVDLRFLVRRARVAGGLKRVEDLIGASRPAHLRGVGGLEAIRLWNTWLHEKELGALRLLVEYNLYDVVNLRTVLEWCSVRIPELWGWTVPPAGPRFERGDVLYDISRLVLSLPSGR